MLSLSLLSFGSLASAQSVRLNSALAQPDAGDVTDFAFSRDGARLLFRDDGEEDAVFELFSVPRDGSSPAVRLHEGLAGSGRDVLSFAAASGGRAVFVADLLVDDVFELFVAPLDGSAPPVPVSGALVADGDVLDFALTGDGTAALFRADKLVDDTPEVFRVPLDGSALPLRLDSQGRQCARFLLMPDDSYVLLVTGRPMTEEFLLRARLDAGAPPVQIARSGPPTFITYTFFGPIELSRDSRHAASTVVEVDIEDPGCQFPRVVGLDVIAGTSTTLSSAFVCFDPSPTIAGGRVLYRDYVGTLLSVAHDGTDPRTLATQTSELVVTPDETRVVFLTGSGPTASLKIIPADGSSPATLLAGPGTLASPRVSPDSGLVTYIATHPASEFRGLFAVTSAGGAPLLLNGPPVARRGALDQAHAPLGNKVVYLEDRHHTDVFELWSVDLALVPRQLSVTPAGFRDVLSFRISPDGAWVGHLGDLVADETVELFGAPIDAATPSVRYREIDSAGPVVGDVLDFEASPSERVVYRADQDVDEYFDLFCARADGRGASLRLTAPLTDASDVLPIYEITPDGRRVVFVATTPFGGRALYSTLVGGGPLLALDLAASDYDELVITPDGLHAVYRRSLVDVRTVRVDGLAPSYELSDTVSGLVSEIAVTPDSRVALFLVSSSGGSHLYRARIDGSDQSMEFGPALQPNGSVASFASTPDSTRVLVLADAQVDETFELYSTATNGFGASVRLNGLLPAGGDVTQYLIATGGRVVYRADQAADDRFELHGVSVLGGISQNLTPMPASGDVEADFRLSDAYVLYRADARTDSVVELFAVKTDGSSAPVAVHPPLSASGDVASFASSPDEAWIVYRADARQDEVFELFSVPANGTGPQPLVVLPATADVSDYRISPDSLHVFYLADARLDETLELFRVPIDGSEPPRRVHADILAASDVQPDFLPTGEGRVLYRLDRASDDAFDLFHFLDLDAERTAPASTPTTTKSLVR